MSDTRVLADEYFAYRQATDLFRLLGRGSLEHLDDWEDLSPAAVADRQTRLRRYAARAETSRAGDALPAVDRVLLDSIAATARSAAEQLTWRSELSLVNPAMGLHTALFTFLGRFPLTTVADGQAYLEKLRRLPDLLGDLAAAVEAAAAEGRVAARSQLLGTVDALDRYLASPTGDDDPLARQPRPAGLPPGEAERWSAVVGQLVIEDLRPSLARYRHALRGVSEQGRGDDRAGLTHLRGGDEVYADLVWAHTTLGMSPEEIHRTGIEQIERLEEEYRALAGPLLGTTEVSELYTRLRDDPSLRYRSGADIVRDATAALAKARAAAPRWFSRLPQSDCVAEEIAQGALAFYSTADPTTGKPGRFFFNTSDPTAWATYQLEAVTFHESIPGHHLQLALHAEADDLHPTQRHLPITAYLEGWGLYTERLADEMGLYGSDLDRIGMLTADSMRAGRLVVDTGLHALGWSRHRAVRFLLDHSPLSRPQVEAEVDRYIGWPGQALSYMVGRLELDRIRAEAEARPGFDITAFHDQVLGHGMVPLTTLRDLVLAG